MNIDGKLIAKIALGITGTVCTILSGVMDTDKNKDATVDAKPEKSEK